MIDEGSPYYSIGHIELRLLLDRFRQETKAEIDPIPKYLGGSKHCQYSTGEHESEQRSIIVSVVINEYSETNTHSSFGS